MRWNSASTFRRTTMTQSLIALIRRVFVASSQPAAVPAGKVHRELSAEELRSVSGAGEVSSPGRGW